MAVEPAPHRFTAGEYHRMAEAAVFGEDDRVELIEGEIVEMAPIGSRHAACVNRLTRLFGQTAAGRVTVSVQNPVLLGPHSEPQPDLALLRPRADDYAAGHPGPGDVLLVVEVADTTASWDREHKLPLYAAAGVRETWLVDLDEGLVEVARRPGRRAYEESRLARPGERLAPEALPDVDLAVADLMPPPQN